MTFGQKFGEILRERGLTQVEAAKLLGTTQGVVSYYSQLKKPPRRKVLTHILDKLGIEVETLALDKKLVEAPASQSIPHPIQSKLREGGHMYRLDDDCDDERVVWMERIKERWIRYPHERVKIELSVRTALPDDADEVINWLNRNR